MIKRERGVALLQALLLSMIVSLLALQLTLTARDQVTTVRLVEERLKADLLIHSLEIEALFNLLTLEDQAPSFKGDWKTGAEARATGQTFAPIAGVTVTISDLSGRLPLRYPDHPLWRGALVQLGMPIAQADDFLITLRDLQANDQSVTAAERNPNVATDRGRYPNRYLQLSNEVEYWLGDWNGWMPAIREISHHYPLAQVNRDALTETLERAVDMLAVRQGIGRNVYEGSADAYDSGGDLNRRAAKVEAVSWPTLRSLQDSELVTSLSSNYWRVDVVVERPDLIRRVKSDILLQSLDNPPFLIIDR